MVGPAALVLLPNGNIKTIDLTTGAIGDYGSPGAIGALDGIEPMEAGFMVTDNQGGRFLEVAPDGTTTDLAMTDAGGGAADLEYIPEEGMVVVPLLNIGVLVAYRVHQ